MFHSFKRGWVAEPWQKEISGKVAFTANDDVSGSGKGWSVSDGAADGEFNIVFDTPIAAEIAVHLTLETTTDDVTVKSEGFTASSRTLKVVVMEAGAAADVECTVHFTFKFQSVNVP